MIGQRVGRYRIVRELGRGGMGSVYEAVEEQIDRRVAIKILSSTLAMRPEMVRRFVVEARAANLSNDPGVVNIHELGQMPDGVAYIVMEYLDGEPLLDRLARGACPLPVALRIARQIASIMAEAHRRQIVHRDLKPANIMLVRDAEVTDGERVKVLDFGLAKLLSDGQTGEAAVNTGPTVVLGTPAYMSPEQITSSSRVDGRADVYSLGVILYQMLTGRLPFTGNPQAVLMKHLSETPAPLRERAPAVDEAVERLVLDMLAKSPEDRPAMDQVAGHLNEIGARPVRPSRQMRQARGVLPPYLGAAQSPLGAAPPAAGGHAGSLPAPHGGALSDTLPDVGRVVEGRPQSADATPPPGEVLVERGRRQALLALLGLLALAGVGLVAAVALLPSPRHGTAPPPGPALAAGGTGTTGMAPPPMVVTPLTPVEPAPTRVHLSLTSFPDRAEVRRRDDGALLGHTPWRDERGAEPGGRLRLRLQLVGFETASVELDLSRDDRHHVRLRPVAHGVPRLLPPPGGGS